MRFVLVGMLVGMLSGCALMRPAPPQPPVIRVEPICQGAPKLSPLTMLPTAIRVIKDEHGLYWIALDAGDYEHLSRNVQALKLALSEARTIIGFYNACVSAAHANERRSAAAADPDSTGK